MLNNNSGRNEIHSSETFGASASNSKLRVAVVKIMLSLFFAIVCLRLIKIQLVDTDHYRQLSQKQYQAKIVLPATRGSIYDCNGNLIASNSMFVSFAADPQLAAEDVRQIASTFSKVFHKPKEFYEEKLQSDSRFVWLERQVHTKYLNIIKPQTMNGIVVRYEPKRLYHNDVVAGQLIGTTDVDNNGIAGIELQYNNVLRGSDGYIVLQRDGLGHARPTVDYPRVEPQRGSDIYLTVDLGVQSIIEAELKKGVEANKADGGIAVAIEPHTGALLSMAQYPFVLPGMFSHSALIDQRLRSITDVFEPGSVFKLVTASAALEAGLVKPEQKFFAENGIYVVEIGNSMTRKIQDVHQYGWLTFQEAMEFSSNIVMAKVSDIIGSDRFYKMARDYGFGMLTNSEVTGEVRGILKKPADWSRTTLNTMSYGYEVGVTPLQIAVAYAAVANGGMLMKPHILMKEISDSGIIVKEPLPQMIRRVVSPATAQTLKKFFVGTVENGTGKPAQVEGTTIAGKTGTSRKYTEGRYEEKSYTASFVGFFPAENPKIVCLVMLDNPRGLNYYGGTTSAPVFHGIAERILNTTSVLAFSSTPTQTANITHQEPIHKATDGRQVNYVVNDALVPDVRGSSARRAVNLLTMRKLEPVVYGSGIVVRQNPEAGTPLRARTKIYLTCQPKSFVIESSN